MLEAMSAFPIYPHRQCGRSGAESTVQKVEKDLVDVISMMNALIRAHQQSPSCVALATATRAWDQILSHLSSR